MTTVVMHGPLSPMKIYNRFFVFENALTNTYYPIFNVDASEYS